MKSVDQSQLIRSKAERIAIRQFVLHTESEGAAALAVRNMQAGAWGQLALKNIMGFSEPHDQIRAKFDAAVLAIVRTLEAPDLDDAPDTADVEVRDGYCDNAKHIVVFEDGLTVYFESEDEACTFQRKWRRAIGLDPLTGEPVPVEHHVLVEGNPIDGYSFIGPFSSAEEANEYPNKVSGMDDVWHTTKMSNPNEAFN